MIAVVDTHILLWWFEQPNRLTKAQRRLLARNDPAHPLGVSDATLWEVASLVEAGRVRLKLSVDEWLSRAIAAPLVTVCAVTPAIAGDLVAVEATRGWDPADRIIVSTARVLGLPLATSDTRIIDSGLVPTID